MRIENVPIEKISPYACAPRRSKHTLMVVSKYLKELGWMQPIFVDAQNVVVVGHTRLMAAWQLRLKTVPVVMMHTQRQDILEQYRDADSMEQEFCFDENVLAEELKAVEDMMARKHSEDRLKRKAILAAKKAARLCA